MNISSTRSVSARDSAAMLRRDRGERKTVVLHAKSLRPRDRARATEPCSCNCANISGSFQAPPRA
jgi:hypothetical protein